MPSDLLSARAIAVVDLGFGDAGKGAVVDFLVRETKATLVVRFNGGAQAGHNVVTPDGRHHTFAQWGAGTFVPGVRSHLARHVVAHPTAALIESEHLRSVGVDDVLARLSIDPDARIVTPFHQAAGRVRELARGSAGHGTCGVGIGETVRDASHAPEDALRMRHLRDPIAARRLLSRARDRLREVVLVKVPGPEMARVAAVEHQIFQRDEVLEIWLDRAISFAAAISMTEDESALRAAPGPVVFEGAQGILLDEKYGFHPFTTWSNCSFDHAAELAAMGGETIFRLGVVRAYAHRHGPGPLPTETRDLDGVGVEKHNSSGGWQGTFRRGWPDFVLARYARRAVGRLDGFALTHIDAVKAAPHWKTCSRYRKREGGNVQDLEPGADLDEQAALTEKVLAASPLIDSVDVIAGARVERVRALFADALRTDLAIESAGPSAVDVRVAAR